MNCLSALLFVLQTFRFIKAELKLDIFQSEKEEPISSTLQENTGKNIFLICKLNNESISDDIFWGWNRKNVQFINLTDLEKLANNNSNPLLQFLNKSDLNQSMIAFHSLSHTDAGKYFCMSLKYKLFNILEINVVGNKTKPPLRLRRSNEKGSVIIPKIFCKSDMFVCNSRSSCLNYEYVCDGIKDCKDGSDENVYVCGGNPCRGKTKCSNGRCISQSLCCDYKNNKNNSCIFSRQPRCCSELVPGNKATYITSNNVRNTVGLKDDGWTFRRGFEGGENNWNEINNPVLKNSYVTKNKVNPKVNNTSSGNKRVTRRKILWILLSPVIVIVTVIGSLAKMWTDKCKTVSSSSNPESINSSFGNNNINQQIYEYRTQTVTNESNNRHLDLPPSYDEATR